MVRMRLVRDYMIYYIAVICGSLYRIRNWDERRTEAQRDEDEEVELVDKEEVEVGEGERDTARAMDELKPAENVDGSTTATRFGDDGEKVRHELHISATRATRATTTTTTAAAAAGDKMLAAKDGFRTDVRGRRAHSIRAWQGCFEGKKIDGLMIGW
ncbi:hypothetical protein VTO42DRAFT_3953 [Malbranchea cinnamomea]